MKNKKNKKYELFVRDTETGEELNHSKSDCIIGVYAVDDGYMAFSSIECSMEDLIGVISTNLSYLSECCDDLLDKCIDE